MKFRFYLLALVALYAGRSLRSADIPTLWAERVKSVVAVEFYVEAETERRPGLSYGTVVDANGTIILPSGAVDTRISPDQLKDFKVHKAGEALSVPGQYLGQDNLTGWHFVRVDPAKLPGLVPITEFAAKNGASPVPALAEEVWGIGLRNKDEDFTPYVMVSRVGLIQSLPQRSAIALHEVAAVRTCVAVGIVVTAQAAPGRDASTSPARGRMRLTSRLNNRAAFRPRMLRLA